MRKEYKMTIEEVAERSARRKNNELRKRYPLFAEQWKVTVESEIERITRQREHAERWLSNLRAKDAEKAKEAKVLQMMAMQLLSGEEYERNLRVYEKFYCDDDGYKSKNFWFKALYGTRYAFAICPNKHLHETEEYGYYRNLDTMRLEKADRCPACGYKN